MNVDVVAGYLGAGKTSTILGMIADDPDPSGLVVLVNEFGELGIDGALMGGHTEVVELASGCICCTLRLDFRTQIIEIADRWHPRRLLIEPTGVATISQVLRALRHGDLRDRIRGVRVVVLVDAVTFAERLRESPGFFTSQVELADVILLNKTDLVSKSRVQSLKAALEQMNPRSWVLPTTHGRLPSDVTLPPHHTLGDVGEAEVLEGFESRSFPVVGHQDRRRVSSLFADLAAGRFGSVERAKAVVQTGDGWYRFDVASGLAAEQPWGPARETGIVVIGEGLATEALTTAIENLGEDS